MIKPRTKRFASRAAAARDCVVDGPVAVKKRRLLLLLDEAAAASLSLPPLSHPSSSLSRSVTRRVVVASPSRSPLKAATSATHSGRASGERRHRWKADLGESAPRRHHSFGERRINNISVRKVADVLTTTR